MSDKNKNQPPKHQNAAPSKAPKKDSKDENAKTIAPHFDTPTSDRKPNTELEVSKTSLGDGFQTDSRP